MEEKVNSKQKKWFTGRLMAWDSIGNNRKMPWKGEKNPYRVWMSEIILQQTRVEQGTAYYEKFIHQYPNPSSLAEAPEESVFKLWEGLGYYSRCKNMISAAREIKFKHNGIFPNDYLSIRALPGVGPYTAAAIASFAFGHPHAVLDGNVFRVLSRFFGIEEPIDGSYGKKLFTQLSEDLLDRQQPAVYNQAIMDLGATICKPRKPLCESCPLKTKCAALLNGMINDLPLKSKKLIRKVRWFNFLLLVAGEKVLVEKRGAKDIWENLYQFPLVESDKVPEFKQWKIGGNLNLKDNLPRFLFQQSQQLTHQAIHGRFFVLQLKSLEVEQERLWVEGKDLHKLPFPRMIARILPELTPYLT